ncbi:hypothetical protein R3W88_002469 [Solanum pinnatisectum]|uniref:NAC domain-containing protein n=1 Tax=Solanum pinnatisectum TaxID=50273 RepID=A0AAV9MLB1_9SOLN|nr:hypothetical protein R3W88_002469 [Solanum pinnatisectum]
MIEIRVYSLSDNSSRSAKKEAARAVMTREKSNKKREKDNLVTSLSTCIVRKEIQTIVFFPRERDVIKYLLVFAIDEPLLEQHQYMQLILEGTNTNAGYFITPLKKEKPHHKRFKRIVGEGTWKIQDPAKEVFDEKGRLMGYVHHMKYAPRTNKKSIIIKELFGEWLMTEYSLYDGYVTNIKKKIIYKDFVICKMRIL